VSTAPKKPARRVRVPVPGHAMVQVLITLPDGTRLKLRATVKEASAWTLWNEFINDKGGK